MCYYDIPETKNSFQRVSNFFEQNFGESKRQLILNGIDLSKSMRPLQDFSTYFIDIKDSVDCELDSQEIETLTKLLHLHDSEIGLRNSNLVIRLFLEFTSSSFAQTLDDVKKLFYVE